MVSPGLTFQERNRRRNDDEKMATYPDLCSQWYINKYDLAEIVNSGKLRSYTKKFSELAITDAGNFVILPYGMSERINDPLTGDDVAELIFRIRYVEEFEKRHALIQEPFAPDPAQAEETMETTTAPEPGIHASPDVKKIIRQLLKEKARKEYDKEFLEAQKPPPRSRW